MVKLQRSRPHQPFRTSFLDHVGQDDLTVGGDLFAILVQLVDPLPTLLFHLPLGPFLEPELSVLLPRNGGVLLDESTPDFAQTFVAAAPFGETPKNPTVATAVGGNRELVRTGETGLLANAGDAGDLADKMLVLAGNEEMRRAMGTGARNFFLKNLRLEAMVGRTEAVYDELLKE